MNYRHAYHAGCFSDVFKHAALALVLEYLKAKDKPFCVIDSHAGVGRYDLTAEAPRKTGEFLAGVARTIDAADRPAALAPYLEALRAVNGGRLPRRGADLRVYPGSPWVARALMRPGDRLLAAELHPEDAAALAAEFARDRQTTVRRMDGYEALKAWLPPAERRGVVLIDPPFEEKGEFRALLAGLKAAHRRWANGIFLIWYPVKERRPVDRFLDSLAASGILRILSVSLRLRGGDDPERLNGCGLAVINPPWRLDRSLAGLVPWLAQTFSDEDGAGSSVTWLVGE